MDIHTINRYISAFYKVVFFVLGTIGNLLFIHLVYKQRPLQSRTSILQCFQCFFHLFCSSGTLMNDVFDIGVTHMKSECYKLIAYYIFFQAAQGLLMLVIVVDMLILVKFPIRYRTISSSSYLLVATIPTLSFSIFTTLYGFTTTNDRIVDSCSPKTAFSLKAGILYKYLYIALALLVLLLYLILIREFQVKSRQPSNGQGGRSLKTMKRLQFTVVIFILTWLSSQIFGLFVLKTSEYSEVEKIIVVHDALFVCLSYANTFYVAMWRSSEYRYHFYSLWMPRRIARATSTSVNSQKVMDQNLVFRKR